jgi:hypothetical protein
MLLTKSCTRSTLAPPEADRARQIDVDHDVKARTVHGRRQRPASEACSS